jgi:hypothetical protein
MTLHIRKRKMSVNGLIGKSITLQTRSIARLARKSITLRTRRTRKSITLQTRSVQWLARKSIKLKTSANMAHSKQDVANVAEIKFANTTNAKHIVATVRGLLSVHMGG